MSQGRTTPVKPNRTPAPSSSRTAATEPGTFTLGAWWRRGISLLLVAHLLLVIVVPLTIMQPSSRLAAVVARWTRPWLDLTQLSHGYGFFATEPGPSHLVKCRFRYDDGREPKPGQIPDILTEKPRLRYHRHFMLAEKLLIYFEPPDPPQQPAMPPAGTPDSKWNAAAWKAEQQRYDNLVKQWQERRAMYELLAKGYAQHMLAASDADAVDLQIEEHMLPSPDAVASGVGLNETESYFFIPGSMISVRREAPSTESSASPESVSPPMTTERRIAVPEPRR